MCVRCYSLLLLQLVYFMKISQLILMSLAGPAFAVVDIIEL